MSAANVAPLSPAALPRSSPHSSLVPGRNLKVDNGTQPAYDDIHPVPAPLLDAWDQKYNRLSIPMMARKDFEWLVTSVLRESERSAATNGILEAALAKRVHGETHELTTRLEQVKRNVFLPVDIAHEVDDLLPFIQQENLHGWSRYIIHTLSVLPQLYSTQPLATTETPSTLTSLSTPPQPQPQPQPQPTNQRATRIQKTRKQGRAAPVRRSGRIRRSASKGVQ